MPKKKVDPKTGETIRQKWEQKYYDKGYLNPDWKPSEGKKAGASKAVMARMNPKLDAKAYKAEAARRGSK